jgi:hypothetical protein
MPNRLLTIHLPQDAALFADLLLKADTVCHDHNLTARVDKTSTGDVVVSTEPKETTDA